MKRLFKSFVSLLIGCGMGVCIVSLWFFFEDQQLLKAANELYEKDAHYQYYYSKLNEDEQENYRRLYYTFSTFKEKVTIHENDIDNAEKIYYSVIDDHPEFYYIESRFEYNDNDDIIIWPKYMYSEEECEQYDQQIDKSTKKIIEKISKEDNDLDKIENIYDYIIENTKYKSNDNDQNILSVFLDQESVCAGYARAYQYLLLEVGIDAVYIGGKSIEDNSSEGHAWVMIRFNDDYYYSDPTWGDVEEEGMVHSCKAYFLMDSEEMLKYYEPDLYYEKTVGDFNYFESIGCFLEEYDRDIVSWAVKYSLENDTHTVEMKCANKEVYNTLRNKIENEYLVYYVLSENHCYHDDSAYLCDESNLMIELYY